MTLTIDFGSDSRGVSDVVGYVLIFSLITATVGVVTVVGFGTLDDRQADERINNVERAFDVFGNNMENVYRDGAPSRATEMRLAGGTLQYGEQVTVTLQNASDSSVNHTMELTPLVYTDGETEIVYAGGAIIRGDSSGSVMIRDPPFTLHPERSLLPFVRTTRAVDRSTVTRDGNVRVESRSTNVVTTTQSGIRDAEELELTVDSPHEMAWNRYLESKADDVEGWEYDETTGTVRLSTDSVSVPRFRIRIRLVS